jgi:hypothetical protein
MGERYFRKVKLCIRKRERERERERENGASKSNVLTSGSLWLTPNLVLINQCLSQNNIFFFHSAYPVRCFLLPTKMSTSIPD